MALTDNLVSYWKLDEASGNAADSVGSNTLTNTGTMTYAAAKINNGAVPASGKYLIATDPSFSEGQNMSWSFWGRPASIPTDFFALTKRVTVTANRSFRIGNNGVDGTMLVSISSDGSSANEGSCTSNAAIFVANETHFYVVTFDGTQASGSRCKIYKDGVDVTGTDATPSTVFNSTANFYLGANEGGGLNWPGGWLDEVGTWNRTLAPSEVTTLYNGGAGLQYPFTTTTAVIHNLGSLGAGA